MQKKHTKFLFALAGCIFGAIIAHPYAMLVYGLTVPNSDKGTGFNLNLTRLLADTFSEKMLPMTIAFSFFCSVIGLLMGLLFERNARLGRLRFEMERRQAVMDSMHKLLAVLSHFILDFTLIIQAGIRQVKKEKPGQNLEGALEKIEEQAERNEQVLKLVRDEFLEHIEDSDSSLSRILELTRNVERRMSR